MRRESRTRKSLEGPGVFVGGRLQGFGLCRRDRASERGVALLVAMMLIVVLSSLAFALLTRTFVASRVAGVERYSEMTFFAADGGVSGAKVRLPIGNRGEFNFDTSDIPDFCGAPAGRPIEVEVSAFLPAGPPRAVVGSQIGGGQGTDGESFCALVYRGSSRAEHPPTGSGRQVSAILSVGPVPLSSALVQVPDSAPGGEK